MKIRVKLQDCYLRGPTCLVPLVSPIAFPAISTLPFSGSVLDDYQTPDADSSRTESPSSEPASVVDGGSVFSWACSGGRHVGVNCQPGRQPALDDLGIVMLVQSRKFLASAGEGDSDGLMQGWAVQDAELETESTCFGLALAVV